MPASFLWYLKVYVRTAIIDWEVKYCLEINQYSNSFKIFDVSFFQKACTLTSLLQNWTGTLQHLNKDNIFPCLRPWAKLYVYLLKT